MTAKKTGKSRKKPAKATGKSRKKPARAKAPPGDAALRDANWRLESILEGTHVGTWEWNVQTGETVFNEVWAQIVGYSLEELAPISIATWESLAHPDDLKQSGELLERHFEGKLPYYEYESRMRHKDGHWVWVHDRGRVMTRTRDGKPLMMFGTHTDITERKWAEEALRESEETFRVHIENSFDVIFTLNSEGVFAFVSPAWERHFGYPASDVVGKSFAPFIHPDDVAPLVEYLKRVYTTGQSETSPA